VLRVVKEVGGCANTEDRQTTPLLRRGPAPVEDGPVNACLSDGMDERRSQRRNRVNLKLAKRKIAGTNLGNVPAVSNRGCTNADVSKCASESGEMPGLRATYANTSAIRPRICVSLPAHHYRQFPYEALRDGPYSSVARHDTQIRAGLQKCWRTSHVAPGISPDSDAHLLTSRWCTHDSTRPVRSPDWCLQSCASRASNSLDSCVAATLVHAVTEARVHRAVFEQAQGHA